MKTYITLEDLFLKTNHVAKGTEVQLTDKAAKYLMHALAEKTAEVPAESGIGQTAPVAVETPAILEPVVEVAAEAVVEAPVEELSSKRGRKVAE